jgi:hypothetical protein
MIKQNLEKLFDFIAQNIPSEQIMQAKTKYQQTTGEIYEDDKSYNVRMALFLEWYLLDNYFLDTKKTILKNIIEENQSIWNKSYLEVCKEIDNNIQALFEVKKIRDNSVIVLDLFKDEKYLVHEADSKFIFSKNDIFQGRVVLHQNNWNFTGYFCFHPGKSQTYIKSEAKKIFIIQQQWHKKLKGLEKELLNKKEISLKNTKYIEKIKIKINRTDLGAKRDNLTRELLILEGNVNDMIKSTEKTENDISRLKIETINFEGKKMISELINKLSYMNLKWERSRQIEISDIYKN